MEKWIDTLYFTSLAAVGGCVSYLTSATDFSLKQFFIKGLSSGFAGYLIFQLCLYAELPQAMTAFLCGTFGYLGSEVTISVIKRYLTNKLERI